MGSRLLVPRADEAECSGVPRKQAGLLITRGPRVWDSGPASHSSESQTDLQTFLRCPGSCLLLCADRATTPPALLPRASHVAAPETESPDRTRNPQSVAARK